ncbi:MAG TPA: DNA mismatch repair protein MutS [Halanaerobiales bacterium]|nr:DNA mismatch repair protein MutS [Halanaerobiales bacterium]
MAELTPMMKQYKKLKKKYPDAILFFRLGDFYEMFFDDAKIAARTLDLALTSRNKGGGEKAPMAGIPAKSSENYIADLIETGHKVAICEQMEDPSESSGIVERDVIRVITPGTVIENELLEAKENNYLASIIVQEKKYGFSYIDISTGEFNLTEFNSIQKIWDEIDRIQPKEMIIDETLKEMDQYKRLKKDIDFLVNSKKNLNYKRAYNILTDHFEVNSLSGFGCEDLNIATIAAGEILTFLEETQKKILAHINRLNTYHLNQYMVLDSATRRNLELSTTIRQNKKAGSLLDIIDKTITSMGGRLIKKWVNQPLINKEKINNRLDAIEELKNNYMKLEKIINDLEGIYDLERILSKITYGSANARDLDSLRFSLTKLPQLKEDISDLSSSLFKKYQNEFDVLTDISKLLSSSIVEDPPVSLSEGGLIKKGYNEELDELRETRGEGKDWIAELQKKERKRTGISSLKVGFNKVFGYYIEVTNANLDKVPEDYERKQTLSNSERYIIPKLKEKEALVLGTEEKINDLEYDLFVEIRDQVGENINRIKKTASIISKIDVISSLAYIAVENNYNRPELKDNDVINIKNGRHPVVENMLDDVFVPNDSYLDKDENRFNIITGPNMSGKSTYMRQVALIVLMAQIGSFVPADNAEIGIVDRIFTRVGASDDLTTGQSTFMVEMNEVSNIVNNATEDSLIILDEVGRGTSTYDGVSIAWAVSKFINDPDRIGARTLFATHYHELTSLEEEFSGIKNSNVLVEEDEEGVHFLHKIVPGRANQSYGIEVARLAGLPKEIILNAENILMSLEKDNELENLKQEKRKEKSKKNQKEKKQMALFRSNDPIISKLEEKDVLDMTPMEAMNFIYELKKELKERERKDA